MPTNKVKKLVKRRKAVVGGLVKNKLGNHLFRIYAIRRKDDGRILYGIHHINEPESMRNWYTTRQFKDSFEHLNKIESILYGQTDSNS